MPEVYHESCQFIQQLACADQYSGNSLFWFKQNPTIVFIVRKNGDIAIRNVWNDEQISIHDLWRFLDDHQKKLIAFNLDKFV